MFLPQVVPSTNPLLLQTCRGSSIARLASERFEKQQLRAAKAPEIQEKTEVFKHLPQSFMPSARRSILDEVASWFDTGANDEPVITDSSDVSPTGEQKSPADSSDECYKTC